jgi:hypothetical protein
MTTIFLVADEREERGQLILGALQRRFSPRITSPPRHGDTAGVRHPAPADQARAEVAASLDAVDAEWRRYVSLL